MNVDALAIYGLYADAASCYCSEGIR